MLRRKLPQLQIGWNISTVDLLASLPESIFWEQHFKCLQHLKNVVSQASYHQVSYLFSLHLLLVIGFPISTCAKLVAILIIALVSYWTKTFFQNSVWTCMSQDSGRHPACCLVGCQRLLNHIFLQYIYWRILRLNMSEATRILYILFFWKRWWSPLLSHD